MTAQTSEASNAEDLNANAGIEVEPLCEWVSADVWRADLSNTMFEGIHQGLHC